MSLSEGRWGFLFSVIITKLAVVSVYIARVYKPAMQGKVFITG